MQTDRQWQLYRELELLNLPEFQTRSRSLKAGWLKRLWQEIARCFDKAPSICEATDAAGHPCWRVYDPVSDTSLQFASHQEVLIWLEQRHSNRNTDRDSSFW